MALSKVIFVFLLSCIIYVSTQQLAADPNFTDTLVIGGLNAPTDYIFIPDGRIFFASKSGIVQVYKNGAILPTPLIDLSAEVQNAGDKGLLSIAVHPMFATNHYIYLLYAVRPDSAPSTDEFAPTFHRLTRYTVNGDVAVLSTRKILLGQDKVNNDGMITCDSSHTDGKMRFAPDYSLMFTFGDGAHWQYDDLGGDTRCVNDGYINATTDVGSFRSQLLNMMNGKVIRIDPETGLGLSDNPFYDPANVIQSRVWALGLRNAFRWSFKPTTDGSVVLLLGDVGFATWEELNEVQRGDNLLWPCYEGPYLANVFATFKGNYCQNFNNFPGNTKFPLMNANHNDAAQSMPAGQAMNAITAAVQYQGNNYPASYRNAIFYSDYARSFISAGFRSGVTTGNINQFMPVIPNALSAVTVDASPIEVFGGDLVYVQLNTGEFRRIMYNTGLPLAVATALPIAGSAPLTVKFSADGSYEVQGRKLGFLWDFGDGTTSDWPNPTHTYTTVGRFNATLTVTIVATGKSAVSSVLIRTDTTSPKVKITNPTSSVYTPGTSAQFIADISANPTVSLRWDLQLVHNGHYHPDTDISTETSPTKTLSVTPIANGERFSLKMYVTATNAAGIVGSDTLHLYPSGYPNNRPVAQFRVDPDAAGSFQMDASPSYDADGDVMFYEWNWGDGSLTPQNHDIFSTHHTYNQNGNYTVTLTVSDNWGGSATVAKLVQVTGLATTYTTAPPTTTPAPTTTTPLPTTTTPLPTTTTPAPTTTVPDTTPQATVNGTEEGGSVTTEPPKTTNTQTTKSPITVPVNTTASHTTVSPTTEAPSSAVSLSLAWSLAVVLIFSMIINYVI